MSRWSGSASVDRVGPGGALSKVTRSTLDAVLLLPAGSVTLLAGIVTVMVPSEAGVTVNVYCWVVAPFWARSEASPPETDTSDMANVAGFIGSPKSTVTVKAELVGEAASVDRVGPGAVLSKVTRSTLDAVLLLSAMSMTRSTGITAVTSPSVSGVRVNVKFWLAEEWARFEAVPPVTDTSDMANVAGSIGLPKSTVTVTDVALVGESASVDRVGPGVVLSKVICRALDAVLLLPAGSVTLLAGIVTVMVPSEAGVTVNVYCWVVAPFWARSEASPPETDTSDMANVAGFIGSPKSTVTVKAELVGEAASVDRVGPGAVLSKVTRSTLDAVLLLSAMSMTRSTGITAVTSPSVSGVRVNVKFWLAEEWARFEAVPPVTDTSDMANVAGSIGLPKSTVTVTDVALVGESASVDRVGPGGALSKVTRSTLDAVLLLPAGSVTLLAGIVTVMVPSEAGVTVNVYCWVVAPFWARSEASPPETDTSDMANVAGFIGSPKSTVTVKAELVGEAASVDRVGPGAVLSKVTRSTLDAVLLLSAMSMTRSTGITAVTSPSVSGVRVNVKFWLAEEWARFEAVPPVTDTSDMANVAGSIGLPKSTVTVTDVALVGESASVDRVGPGVVLSKVICRALDAVLLLPAGSVTLLAGIVTVMVPSEAGVTVNVYCWVVAPFWARSEASPPETDTSDMANVAGFIGSPKSTVTVKAELVGEAASVDRVGPGAVLSKVTRSTLDAVLLLSAMSMTRSTGITAVTSPSVSGVRVNVKFWLAEEWARFEAVPPVTDTSDMANVAGSIGLPKSTVTVTDVALVGESASVDRVGPGVVLSKVICRALDAVLLLPAGSVTLLAGIVTVMVPSEAGVTVNVYCWVVAPFWARSEASPPETDTSDMANVAGFIGSPKSTVTVKAELVGEAASVDRVGPGAVLSKVTRSTLDAVLLLSAMSMTRSTGITAVTSPSVSGVRVNVKFWLAEEWARFEAVPPETDTSDMSNVAGFIGSPKSTVTVTDAALVGESASVDRAGTWVVLSKVICRALDAVLLLPAGSVTRPAGIVTVMVPSEVGVTVKVYCWVVAPFWARSEASPPVTDTSDMANVSGSIGSPKSTVTVADAALVGEAASVDRAGTWVVLSKVTLSTLDAELRMLSGSVTAPAGISTVTSPSASGVRVNVKVWLAEEWARLEAVPSVAEMSLRVNVSGSIGSPKSTVTVTDAALVTGGESVVKLGAGPARTMMVTILVWLAVLGSERRMGAVTASGCSPAGGGSSGLSERVLWSMANRVSLTE